MTTLATLTRVEGSMLAALAEALSDDEVLFIDRDGPSFRYVLNYLRDPFAKPLLPRDPTERDQLCLLYTSPSPRDVEESRMPSSA